MRWDSGLGAVQTKILYFIAAAVLVTLLSKHWDALKYSFAATLLSLIGALASGVAWQVSLDADFAESVAAAAGSTGAP